jgi:hypothetical protein
MRRNIGYAPRRPSPVRVWRLGKWGEYRWRGKINLRKEKNVWVKIPCLNQKESDIPVLILNIKKFWKLRCPRNYIETRTRHAYRDALHRTTGFEHLPSQLGVKFLNALPENLRSERSEQNLSKFKARLKGYLVVSTCYSVGEFFGH